MNSFRPDGPAALQDFTTTEQKRISRYRDALARRRAQRDPNAPKQKERVIPGLDVEALRAKYSGDAQNTTQVRIGTFKVPMGITMSRWEKYRNAAAERFLKALEQQGWQVDRITARPGMYPYRDVLTGADDPAFREMQLVAVCGLRKAPEAVVVHLDPEDVEPTVIRSA